MKQYQTDPNQTELNAKLYFFNSDGIFKLLRASILSRYNCRVRQNQTTARLQPTPVRVYLRERTSNYSSKVIKLKVVKIILVLKAKMIIKVCSIPTKLIDDDYYESAWKMPRPISTGSMVCALPSTLLPCAEGEKKKVLSF